MKMLQEFYLEYDLSTNKLKIDTLMPNEAKFLKNKLSIDGYKVDYKPSNGIYYHHIIIYKNINDRERIAKLLKKYLNLKTFIDSSTNIKY